MHAVGVLRNYLQRALPLLVVVPNKGIGATKNVPIHPSECATNYSTTYATRSTTQRVRTNKHTTDKDVTTCNAHRDEKDNEEPKGGSTVRSHMYLPRCTVHTCNKATPNGKTVRYGNNHPRGTRMVRTSMHKHVGDIDATVHSDVG